MANRYSSNIITIDTTDTQVGGNSPSVGMPEGCLRIKQMFWQGNDTAGKDIADLDDLTILFPKINGTEHIALRASYIYNDGTRAYVPQLFNILGPFDKPWMSDGFYVEDIDGGELVIILE